MKITDLVVGDDYAYKTDHSRYHSTLPLDLPRVRVVEIGKMMRHYDQYVHHSFRAADIPEDSSKWNEALIGRRLRTGRIIVQRISEEGEPLTYQPERIVGFEPHEYWPDYVTVVTEADETQAEQPVTLYLDTARDLFMPWAQYVAARDADLVRLRDTGTEAQELVDAHSRRVERAAAVLDEMGVREYTRPRPASINRVGNTYRAHFPSDGFMLPLGAILELEMTRAVRS